MYCNISYHYDISYTSKSTLRPNPFSNFRGLRIWGRRLYVFFVIAKSLSFSINSSTVCKLTFYNYSIIIYPWDIQIKLWFLISCHLSKSGCWHHFPGRSNVWNWLLVRRWIKIIKLLEFSVDLIFVIVTHATCFCFVCRNGVEIIRERILLIALLTTVHFSHGESRKRSVF